VSIDAGGPEPIRVPLANLLPLLHARDAAQAKVASIGSVNPRRGGPVNTIIQTFKRTVARSLGWFVRDQITFNRHILSSIEAAMEAMTEFNASLSLMAAQFNHISARFASEERRRGEMIAEAEKLIAETVVERIRGEVISEAEKLIAEAEQLKDIRLHWYEWRLQWEKNLAANEMQYLRSVADLQTGFSHRATLMETNMREHVTAQHADYLGALDRSTLDIQKRLWADLEKIRGEYERLIHNELRILRLRAQPRTPLPQVVDAATAVAPSTLDYARFAERFRGSEEYVRKNQQIYIPIFQGVGSVLDIGCGRGEFLELLRDNGV
jgi:hypothetical protein